MLGGREVKIEERRDMGGERRKKGRKWKKKEVGDERKREE